MGKEKPFSIAKTYNKEVTKCNQKLIEAVCKVLRTGVNIETAVVVAGISRKTFYRWMAAANNKNHPNYKPIYAKLRDRALITIEEVTVRDLMTIERAAQGHDQEYHVNQPGTIDPETGEDISGQFARDAKGNPLLKRKYKPADWGASAWRLERRNNLQWGRKDTVTVNNGFGGDGDSEGEDKNKIIIEFVHTEPRAIEAKSEVIDVTPEKDGNE